ncbi:MAG TPA: Ig-like domain-containing protein [Gemmatimonadales bacterium]|nr:Ig-like domain-containing protein [Gemmatimonadales bacterium]
MNNQLPGWGVGGRLIVAAGLVLACTDSQAPSAGRPLPPTPFVVSNPVPGLPALPSSLVSANRSASAASVSSVIYVSLPPGAIPGANAAIIHDRQTGSSVSVSAVNGGFDPVAVGAAAGDTIEVVVLGSGITHPVSYLIVVAAKARPGVVRTNPPSHKRDVPLNTIIEVVFSEPMDSASLLGAVTLTQSGAPVPGSVVIPPNGGDILRATFVPLGSLAPLTTYELGLSTGARDRDGQALGASVTTEFTTDGLPADTTAPVVTILSPTNDDSEAVEYASFRATISEGPDVELIDWLFDDGSGNPPSEMEIGLGSGGGQPDIGDAMYFLYRVYPTLHPGTYTVRMTASDGAGNAGTSAPLTVTFVAPDSQPRIVVRSFSVIEYLDYNNSWGYAPRLVVADAPGQSGLDIVGFEMLDIPGYPYPFGFPGFMAQSLSVPPSQDTQLFHDLYGDYEISYYGGHGGLSGGQATARLTYRDGGHIYATTLTGPIVSGTTPANYTGGCNHWVFSDIRPGDMSWCWGAGGLHQGR